MKIMNRLKLIGILTLSLSTVHVSEASQTVAKFVEDGTLKYGFQYAAKIDTANAQDLGIWKKEITAKLEAAVFSENTRSCLQKSYIDSLEFLYIGFDAARALGYCGETQIFKALAQKGKYTAELLDIVQRDKTQNLEAIAVMHFRIKQMARKCSNEL